ncbi:predicted protein [Nematostella vectensis]|uniref:ShKT domain-containing protein n=1 Tax=Nematostella vectensis TaxID=45351 RepID=A7SMA6_NEMVE|nr:predicted protein [Nematostella vectensis]|eukprot:XP_001627252.1 predicted protein [Nematostella vectensis]
MALIEWAMANRRLLDVHSKMHKEALLVFLCCAVSVWASENILRDCKQNIYGCCPDGKTDAKGRGGEGCGVEMCMDMMNRCDRIQKFCKLGSKPHSELTSGDYNRLRFMKNNCAKTCGMCKHRAPRVCERSIFGCCWDNSPAQGPDTTPGVDCPVDNKARRRSSSAHTKIENRQTNV